MRFPRALIACLLAMFSWKSMNGGANWVKLRGPDMITDPYGPDPPVVVIDPRDSITIYFAKDDSWQRSDGGASWTDIGCVYYYTAFLHDSQAPVLYIPQASGMYARA